MPVPSAITASLLCQLLAKHSTQESLINDELLEDVVIDGTYNLIAMAQELSTSFAACIM